MVVSQKLLLKTSSRAVPEPVEGPPSEPTYQLPNAPVSTGSTSAEPKVPEPVGKPEVPEPAVAEQGRSIEGSPFEPVIAASEPQSPDRRSSPTIA